MKTRIKYYGGWYYAQYRKWGFWHHVIKLDNYASFKTMEEAKIYLEESEWLFNNKIVWKST